MRGALLVVGVWCRCVTTVKVIRGMLCLDLCLLLLCAEKFQEGSILRAYIQIIEHVTRPATIRTVYCSLA